MVEHHVVKMTNRSHPKHKGNFAKRSDKVCPKRSAVVEKIYASMEPAMANTKGFQWGGAQCGA